MTERLHVSVSFEPALGFISAASHKVPRSLTAPSLDGLRRRIVVMVMSRRGRPDVPVIVDLDLDAAAMAEAQRRSGYR
jgi:hypothetical protein